MSRFNIDFVILIKRNLYVDYIRNLRKKMEINKKAKMEQLYYLYESAVYAIAYSILNNVEQAEDVTQDTFLKIYSYLDDIEEVGYELKMTEIADILGKDSATIRKQMERARKYLAEKLENVTEDIR